MQNRCCGGPAGWARRSWADHGHRAGPIADRAQATNSWTRPKASLRVEYAKQLLYTQCERQDGESLQGAATLQDASDRSPLLRGFLPPSASCSPPSSRPSPAAGPPCCWWTRSTRRPGVPSLPLEVRLTRRHLPELGTLPGAPRPSGGAHLPPQRPQLSHRLNRRCPHLYIDFPSPGARAEDRPRTGCRRLPGRGRPV